MAGLLDIASRNVLGASVMNPQSDSIDLWNRLQHLEARITILENPQPDLANYAELLNQNLQQTRDALKEEAKQKEALTRQLQNLTSATKAFMRYFPNPVCLASDEESQWHATWEECHRADDLLALQSGRS